MARYLKSLVRIALMMIGVALLPLDADALRVHCQEDSAKLIEILESTAAKGGTLGERIVFAAQKLEGIPWSGAHDNDSVGTMALNLHGLDRMEFLNVVMAIADASMKSNPDIKDYENSYESFSRRKGVDDGFGSQLLYGADWIVDNVYRGHVKEMTEYLTGGGFKTKTLDYVSRHKDEYPALRDEATLEKVKMMEMGYRSHRIPHLKKQSAGNKPLHELMENGDIIMMLSNDIDRDVYDIGFIELKNGEPYLIHVSHDNGKVVTDPYPLARLFKLEGQYFYGYRWLRPTE